MRLVFGQDEEIAEWVAKRIPHMPTGFTNMKCIGVQSESGVDLGAVVFHEFRGNDIQMSCASDSRRWISKTVLAALFGYPFEQLKVDRVTSFIPARNTGVRRFIEKLGFSHEGTMRRGFDGDDCAIYGMLREECTWIKGK